jgi:hypothetical protein
MRHYRQRARERQEQAPKKKLATKAGHDFDAGFEDDCMPELERRAPPRRESSPVARAQRAEAVLGVPIVCSSRFIVSSSS